MISILVLRNIVAIREERKNSCVDVERRRKTFEILLTEYLMTGIMAPALCRQNFILPHLFPETTSLQAEYKLDCCKQIKEIKENIPIDENNLPNHVETRTNYLLVFLNI